MKRIIPNRIKHLSLIIAIAMITSCGSGFGEIKEEINQEFGNSHFTTAIALIELHNIRYGEYPKKLRHIKYKGDWDKMAFYNVKYKRLPEGYSLDLKNGYLGKPNELTYPPEFWQGLGLVKSNLKPESYE